MLLPKKNEEFLKTLLRTSEGLTIDFKQSITSAPKIAKTLVAFANSEGGTIVIGVSDKKKIVGIDPEEEIFMIEKAANQYCDPSPQLEFEVFENVEFDDKNMEVEKAILLVQVKKSDQKHFFKSQSGKKVLYMRKDDQTLPLQ